MKPTWEKPKTTKIYLHTPGASRILMLHPDAKITNLSLKHEAWNTRQDGCGVHLLVSASDPQALDPRQTHFDRVSDGLPFYTVRGRDPENGAEIAMSAFATDDAQPLTYVRITVSNEETHSLWGRIGLLPREAPNADQYLTGIFDVGYVPYQPSLTQWLLLRSPQFSETAPFTASAHSAEMQILAADGFHVKWISRDKQPSRFLAHDYFACDYTLAAGEQLTLDFVFSATPLPLQPASLEEARAKMLLFWKALLSRVRAMPKTDSVRIRDLYLQNVTQCMQMVSQYDGIEGQVVRTGDVGRFLWIWEAIHVLKCLAQIGFPEYGRIYDTYCSFVIMDGEERGKFNYPYIHWDNDEGALLLGLCEHLKIVSNAEQYHHYRPYLQALLSYIQKRRASNKDALYPGLYPSSPENGWGRHSHHWIFTDAFLLRAIRSYLQVCKLYSAEETVEIAAIEADYSARIQAVANGLYQGHERERAYILPHIAGVPFEDCWNHSFYTDGAPFLSLLGIVMTPHSRMFEQMECFYRDNGLFEYGLAGRITNAADYGTYAFGDCYAVGIAELCWIYPWMKRGEWSKADAMTDALLRYSVTTEYVVSEQYCSVDPWYVPWQPNGAGSARLCLFLLDYYDYKAAYQQKKAP